MLLITQPRVGAAHNEIIALQMAADSLGWNVYPSEMSWRLPEHIINSGEVGVPYGSQLFCETIAQQMNWKLKAHSFDWLSKIPYEFTSRKIDFMTLAEAKNIKERKFIKPADDKCFDAKIYEPGEFQPSSYIEDNYPVLVSEIVEWKLEYRCFIDGSFVKTWSNYIFFEEINNPKYHKMVPANLEKIEDFVFEMMLSRHVNKDGTYIQLFDSIPSVVDIGVIPGRGWAVIETNPAWASGLYGCDPVEALLVMEQACERIS